MCNMEPVISTTPAVEVWRPVRDYEGLYDVSSLGRVRSLDRIANCKHRNGKEFTRTVKGHISAQVPNNNGYMMVWLHKNGDRRNCLVHRLVAEAFIQNPDNLPQVNHKDENPKNNMPDNLEWCTAYYNINYKDERVRSVLNKTHNEQ